MKTYTKFLLRHFFNSFVKISFILTALILIINIFEEIDFFKRYEVHFLFPMFMSFLNTPSIIFEVFPFIFLIATQVFFIKLIDSHELKIFKYSGLRNLRILTIISVFTFFLGIIIITLFYNMTSQFKNQYIKIKNNYSNDNKYLAVITENGLWIRDEMSKNINIINASQIDGKFLIDVSIVQFNKNNQFYRLIDTKKVDISRKEWVIYEPTINKNNKTEVIDSLLLNTNFDLQKINSLFSNLSSLTIFELYDLRKNYKKLNYSTVEIKMHLLKIFSYPIYLTIITVLSGILMFNIKHQKNSIFKIVLGIFISVVVYYLNYFFYVLGNNQKIPITFAIWLPLIMLTIVNFSFIIKINEK